MAQWGRVFAANPDSQDPHGRRNLIPASCPGTFIFLPCIPIPVYTDTQNQLKCNKKIDTSCVPAGKAVDKMQLLAQCEEMRTNSYFPFCQQQGLSGTLSPSHLGLLTADKGLLLPAVLLRRLAFFTNYPHLTYSVPHILCRHGLMELTLPQLMTTLDKGCSLGTFYRNTCLSPQHHRFLFQKANLKQTNRPKTKENKTTSQTNKQKPG